MYRVKVIDRFSAAHQLEGYMGKCEGLHGHNWKVEVEVEGENLDEVGMLIDFRKMKELLRNVLEGLDHRMLNELEVFKEGNPSAELIAQYIYSQVKIDIPAEIFLVSVSVWESDDSQASYFEI